jgi:RNA methyltransferase, TrmH family
MNSDPDLDPVIRSRTNAQLKRVGAVLSGKEREQIVLEGDRLVDDAIAAGVELEVLLVAEDREQRARELEARELPVRRIEVPLLQRVSALGTTPGVLALAKCPARRELSTLDPVSARLVLVVAGVQDPGNLGALARSAEAAGAQALVVLSGGARAFGDKALRGSMGSLLRLPVHEVASAAEAAKVLGGAGYRQVCAATRDGKRWDEFNWSGPVALWVSGETGELPELTQAFEHVTIPMRGSVESLNITVAASLLLFAAGSAR